MNTGNFHLPEDESNPYSAGRENIHSSPYGYTPYSANTEAFQALYQPGQFQSPPYSQHPRRRRTFSQWYRAQTPFAKLGLGCLPLYLAFLVCIVSATVYGSTHPQPPDQRVLATSVTNNNSGTLSLETATPATLPASVPTATPTTAPSPIPTASATPKPTPKPTAKPTQPPPPTPCPGVNCNPWGYNFTSGNLIYNPPSNFCSYFNCIASFWGPDDPGDGFVIECSDATYSQSGGESGACSYHGGELRPLYSH